MAKKIILRLETDEIAFVVVLLINNIGAFDTDVFDLQFREVIILPILTLLASTQLSAFHTSSITFAILLLAIGFPTIAPFGMSLLRILFRRILRQLYIIDFLAYWGWLVNSGGRGL